MMKFRRSLLLLCFLTTVGISCAAVENISAAGDASMLSLETLHSSRQKQQSLARYAKDIFLHRLGFGPAVSPPCWTTGIQSACFVTFFARKRVIACSGGFRPRTADLGKEVEANVRQALHLDPRAEKIDRAAAVEARILITFPGELRPVASPALIDPLREGLFVENDRSGVAIVPGEAKTSAWAYREALRRLGESDSSRVRLYVFDSWVISGKD